MKDLFGVPGRVAKNHIDDHPKKQEIKEKTIRMISSKLIQLSQKVWKVVITNH